MRVVYDTNVAAMALLRRGEILKLKQGVKSGAIIIITSPFILDELTEVLRMRLNLTKQRAKANIAVYAKIAEIVKPVNIEQVTRDPDDDYILATAVAGKAQYIVTLDKDLLVLKEYESIRIVTAVVFYEKHKLDNFS